MTVAESLEAFAPGPRPGRRARLVAARATSRPPSAARTPARSSPAAAVDVALRLLELGVDEVCFGDTIGVGVPSQVGELSRRWRSRPGIPLEPDRVPLPRHARHGPRQRRRRARGRHPLLRLVDRRHRRLSLRARRRRQPRHGGPRLPARRARATSTACASRASSRPPDSSPRRSGRPLASKVGQAGGWDPATGAATGRE